MQNIITQKNEMSFRYDTFYRIPQSFHNFNLPYFNFTFKHKIMKHLIGKYI